MFQGIRKYKKLSTLFQSESSFFQLGMTNAPGSPINNNL